MFRKNTGNLFRGKTDVLDSHRGWDPGALELALELNESIRAPLFSSSITRLMVDLNRSESNPQLFSEFTRGLPLRKKEELLEDLYHCFRNEVFEYASNVIQKGGKLLHLSIHSFTPVLKEVERKADLGLLYDPSRAEEKAFCLALRERLRVRLPGMRVRFNYPYLGVSDGHTRALRKRFPERYIGIEIEVNQRFPLGPEKDWRELKEGFKDCLMDML